MSDPTPDKTSDPLAAGEGPATDEPLKDYSASVQPPAPTSSLDEIVEQWWDNHIRGSIAVRETSVWNHLMAAKDLLKQALRGG